MPRGMVKARLWGKAEGRQPDSHVLLCKKAPTLPLARLRRGEYHEVVLIGLVPA